MSLKYEDALNDLDRAIHRKARGVGGIVPIMKSIASIKVQLADLEARVSELEDGKGVIERTEGRVEGLMKGFGKALVTCEDCDAVVQADKFPRHWLRLHAPTSPEKEPEKKELEKTPDKPVKKGEKGEKKEWFTFPPWE